MLNISIVSPVYKAEDLVESLVYQLRTVLIAMDINFEIILIEDGSPDGSWTEIKKACSSYPEVIGIRLSKNFGQHYAISAGLTRAKGEWIIVMDCDLQDRPSEIPRLFTEAQKGHDIVMARRSVRRDTWLKRLSSKLFYSVLSYLTGVKQDPAVANFGIYNRKVIATINSLPESIRYFPTMVQWVGYRSTKLNVEHAERPKGTTSYSIKKLFNLALDICLANSDKPLRLVIKIGFLVSLIGFLFAGYTAIEALRGEIQVLGYASLLVSLWILSGLIIFIVGVVGLYVGKSFEGIKNRPPFIIDEVIGDR